MKVFEVPVLVKVTVEVADDGAVRVVEAGADNEAGPWAFSAEPAAWDRETETWEEGHGSAGQAPWETAYQWLEGVDLLDRAHLAHVKALLVAPLRAFDAWPAHARQDGLVEAYKAAHRALAMLDNPANPFKHYLRRMPKREGGA